MNIYTILLTKPHNHHYLNRYVKFIETCKIQTTIEYTENHHICPKAADLFPEYKSGHNWNIISLTARQHFIAHWLLWKTFGGSQTFSFMAMCSLQSNKHQKRYKNISSRSYSTLKQNHAEAISSKNKGMASYIDETDQKVWCSTTDNRVTSGQLISTSKGRKYKPRSIESRNTSKLSAIDAQKKRSIMRVCRISDKKEMDLRNFTRWSHL